MSDSTPVPAPSSERQQVLVRYYSAEIILSPRREAIADYTEWDDLVEDPEESLTYEEWEWCSKNLIVEQSTTVRTADDFLSNPLRDLDRRISDPEFRYIPTGCRNHCSQFIRDLTDAYVSGVRLALAEAGYSREDRQDA